MSDPADGKPKRVRKKPVSAPQKPRSKKPHHRSAQEVADQAAKDKIVWDEQRAALVKELNSRFRHTGLNSKSTKELCAKYGRSERSIIAAAAAQGINIGGPPDRVTAQARDTQYGVLQPAANIFGGCVNIWLWAIVIFLLVGVIVVVKSLFY